MSYPRQETCHHLVCEFVRDVFSWNMPLPKCTVWKTASTQHMSPTNKRSSVFYVVQDGRQIGDALVGSIKDFRQLNPEPSRCDIVRHHGNNFGVTVVRPWLSASSAPAVVIPSPLFRVPPQVLWTTPIGPHAITATVPTRAPSSLPPYDRRNQPLGWLKRAVDGFCKANVVCDLVDQQCGPSELLTPTKLCIHEHCIEQRAPVAQNRLCDTAAYVCRERFTSDVDFLQIQHLADVEEALIVVAVVPK
jgi:hypothetical protein